VRAILAKGLILPPVIRQCPHREEEPVWAGSSSPRPEEHLGRVGAWGVPISANTGFGAMVFRQFFPPTIDKRQITSDEIMTEISKRIIQTEKSKDLPLLGEASAANLRLLNPDFGEHVFR
jgi:hypothetical protein